MKHVITVIGAGNGGTAIAAHLTSAGAETRLCDLFPQYIEGIKTAGGIELTDNGKTVFLLPCKAQSLSWWSLRPLPIK